MFERVIKFIAFWVILIPFAFISCGKDENLENSIIVDETIDGISKDFTFIDQTTGIKAQERVALSDFEKYFNVDINQILNAWDKKNGDIFFFRGSFAQKVLKPELTVIIPFEILLYWNGICIYNNGFCYQTVRTDEGLRIYNSGLWRLSNYCIIAHARPIENPQSIEQNSEMLNNIHKRSASRAALKKEIFEVDKPEKFTPPGLVWKFYKNLGKEIRKAGAGEYIKASDFIEKTDSSTDGYFRSATDNFDIINVYIHPQCSKVW